MTTSVINWLGVWSSSLVNGQVHSIMPVLEQKPIGIDSDDELHSKLVERQYKNNIDASPVFASLPIGPAVVVQ